MNADMFKLLVFLSFGLTIVSGQLASNARLNNHVEYWLNMMHELFHELEAREWCNLKLNDIQDSFDDNLYDMRVSGNVRYTNGFVVSIQHIQIIDITQSTRSRTVDGVAVPFGTVSGKINLNDLMVGFDVYANLTSPAGEYWSTGTFLHTRVQIEIDLSQNLITKELSSSPIIRSVSFGSGTRMRYLPSSHITEALSRRFWHSTFDSAQNWARNIFVPIMIDVATNKLGFPEICFNNCS